MDSKLISILSNIINLSYNQIITSSHSMEPPSHHPHGLYSVSSISLSFPALVLPFFSLPLLFLSSPLVLPQWLIPKLIFHLSLVYDQMIELLLAFAIVLPLLFLVHSALLFPKLVFREIEINLSFMFRFVRANFSAADLFLIIYHYRSLLCLFQTPPVIACSLLFPWLQSQPKSFPHSIFCCSSGCKFLLSFRDIYMYFFHFPLWIYLPTLHLVTFSTLFQDFSFIFL